MLVLLSSIALVVGTALVIASMRITTRGRWHSSSLR